MKDRCRFPNYNQFGLFNSAKTHKLNLPPHPLSRTCSKQSDLRRPPAPRLLKELFLLLIPEAGGVDGGVNKKADKDVTIFKL